MIKQKIISQTKELFREIALLERFSSPSLKNSKVTQTHNEIVAELLKRLTQRVIELVQTFTGRVRELVLTSTKRVTSLAKLIALSVTKLI